MVCGFLAVIASLSVFWGALRAVREGMTGMNPGDLQSLTKKIAIVSRSVCMALGFEAGSFVRPPLAFRG